MPTANDDDLRRAYAQLAQPDWPDLAELKRSAARYELVLGLASRQTQPLRALGRALRQAQPCQATSAPRPSLTGAAPSLRTFDPKRAAAGDLDEQDAA